MCLLGRRLHRSNAARTGHGPATSLASVEEVHALFANVEGRTPPIWPSFGRTRILGRDRHRVTLLRAS
jgi:hypothetical protein